MAIYLKHPSAKGNVSTKGYSGWIKLNDCDFAGVTNSSSNAVGKMQNRTPAAPKFGQITLSKPLDESSHCFFEAAHSGKPIDKLEIHYLTLGSNPAPFAKIILQNVVVNHYSENMTAASHQAQELIILTYSTIQRTFIPYDDSEKAKSPIATGYNLETAEKM